MAYRSFREVLAGSTPASIRRLQSIVVTQIPANTGKTQPGRLARPSYAPCYAPLRSFSIQLNAQWESTGHVGERLPLCLATESIFVERYRTAHPRLAQVSALNSKMRKSPRTTFAPK